jgi:hypothetical protein
MTDPLLDALDGLVPAPSATGDWDDVLARSSLRRTHGRRLLVVGVAAALVVVVAAPALAYLLGWIGRRDVAFSHAKPAPNIVKKRFYDLGLGAPPRFAFHVQAGRAREVGTFTIHGHPRKLWVAPTRGGGFCFFLEQSFGGCQRAQDRRRFPLSVSWMGATPRTDAPGSVGGTISSARAARLELVYEDGSRVDIPFVFVSKPIGAGFFSYDVKRAHWTRGHRARALLALDARGHELARQAFPYVRRRRVVHVPLPLRPRTPRTLPTTTVPPTPPLQRASARGVSVVAGANGSAIFRTGDIDLELRPLLARSVDFVCFRIVRVFGILEDRALGIEGRLAPTVALRYFGVRPPWDGCEIQGEYGHRWPDRFGSHSAVELPFTAVGRRWFSDRAAARDLALFVRSRRMHELRKETGAVFARDLRAAYPSLGRIRYRLTPTGVTFSEGRFRVVVSHGRIVRQNLKPYAFVF